MKKFKKKIKETLEKDRIITKKDDKISSISVKDLTDAVNALDKEFGLKLKHPDISMEPEHQIQIKVAQYEFLLSKLICIINGIDIETYFSNDETWGMNSGPIGNENTEFTNRSILRWNDTKSTYNISSMMFRCRFISLVLTYFIGRLEDITKNMVLKCRYKHSTSEHQLILLDYIMEDLIRFSKLVLLNKPYKNTILKINEYIMYSKKKVDSPKMKKSINGTMIDLRRGLEESKFIERFYSDDLGIFQVLNLSYMITTLKPDAKKVLPKFKHIENATIHHNLIGLIEALGDEILFCKKKNPLMNAYIESRPKIMNHFGSELCNQEMRVGVMSLSFVSFICNDKTINKFISQMMKLN